MNFLGLPIGFYGNIFPGNINIMMMELYGSKKFKVLFMALALIVIFESAYCLLTLYYLSSIKEHEQLFFFIEVGSYVLVMAMGFWMFFNKKSSESVSRTNTFYRGIITTIIHPQQIPFWIIIGVLIDPVVNYSGNWNTITGFVLYNALGTFLAMVVYMVFGNKLMLYFKFKLRQVNAVMGIVYIVFAVFSIGKMFVKF